MRVWLKHVLFTIVGLALSVTSAPAAQIGSHVRIADGDLRALKEDGAARSATFRDLLTRLDATSVLVFVDCDWYPPNNVAGHLVLMTVVDDVRYVRVAMKCSLPGRQRLPTLAHELQHALEIGENPAVTDEGSMESYFEEVGYSHLSQRGYRWFETAAAIMIQQRVERELYGRPKKDDRILPR